MNEYTSLYEYNNLNCRFNIFYLNRAYQITLVSMFWKPSVDFSKLRKNEIKFIEIMFKALLESEKLVKAVGTIKIGHIS